MRRLIIATLALALAGADAQACGRRGLFARGCRPRAYGTPVAVAPVPTSAALPVPAPAPPVMAAPPVVAAPPLASAPPAAAGPAAWEYTADGRSTPAYFVTLDESGKPIPVQWMDWLFRGGKDAGMPRPPLPIIGRLRGN